MIRMIITFLLIAVNSPDSYSQVSPNLGDITTTIFISPNGDDNNDGSINFPLATFSEALFHCPYGTAGETSYSEVVYLNGNYQITEEIRQPCWQFQNGNGYKAVSIRGENKDSVFLDGSTASYLGGKFINLLGSGISVRDLNITLASSTDTSSHYATIDFRSLVSPCSGLASSDILVKNVSINACYDHGLNITESSNVLVEHVDVQNANLINISGSNEPGGWGSGIKVRLSNNVEIRNCRVEHCWGEGIANARCTGMYVHHNEISDNYSVNIYLDNVIGGDYFNNLCYGTIGDTAFWRGDSPAPGFGIATEYYADNDFAETSDVRIHNNIILNTQGIYLDDNRTSSEPAGAEFKNIWIVHNSMVGWQGNLSSNLRAIRIDFAGYNNGLFSMDSIYLENNLISRSSAFTAASGNGQMISGTSSPLPATLFYGYNYWGTSPEKFSFYSYPFDPVNDLVDEAIPNQIIPSQIYLIEPTAYNLLSYEGNGYPFVTKDFFDSTRNGNFQIGAINPNLINPQIEVALESDCIRIFPNPTDDIFDIQGLTADYSITILDSQGNIFQTINTNSASISIDINTLPTGMYFIEIVNTANTQALLRQLLKWN